MEKIKHLIEVILAFIIPIPSLFITAILQSVESWTSMFIYKYIFIIFFRLLDFLLFLISAIALIDGVQGIFTEESIIPKIKKSMFG